MNININQQSPQAIYEQIVEQIKNEIIRGSVAEKDALPSIRTLAKELRVSVITTKRAYEELEKDGLIYSVPGKGFFVAKQNRNILRENKVRKIEDIMSAVIAECKGAELTKEEAVDMLTLLWEEEGEDNEGK
ncbi:MAG: GntR family transcriptional regulator [Clostridiales bacterium]|nr:GntR family transcriptional regulator [Clostridiales bacterium]